MSADLQQQICTASRAWPRPVLEADAEETALAVIAENDPAKGREFIKWFAANGAQLCKLLNEG